MIKQIKKLLIYAIVIGLLTNCAIITNAKSNKSLRSDNCTVAETSYDTEINVTGQTPYNISELQVSKKTVTIQYTGESEFVDVIGIDRNREKYYLSEYAVWSSSDSNVVYADRGRLLAEGAGEATIKVTYGEFEETIKVKVKKDVDYTNLFENSISTYNMTNEQRVRYVQNANDMVSYRWTPTQTLTGWNGNYTFNAGTTYNGIPYTQSPNQTNLSAFKSALSKIDFYSTYTNTSGVMMPRYGNDCSGFLSFAYELPRQNTTQFVNGVKNGTYRRIGSYDPNNITQSDLLNSYPQMVAGDALVKSGHAMFVANNVSSEGYCLMYEQTPGRAQTTRWTYSSLAAAGYMPFSK